MFSLLFAAALSTATGAPGAAPSAPTPPRLSAPWQSVPLGENEYAHFVRPEKDGSVSELTGVRQVCDCQPPNLISELSTAFGSLGATLKPDDVTICGQPAKRLIVTGLASPTNERRNMEVIAFRREPALVMFMYSFRYAAPMPDVESSFAALCP